MTRRPLRVGHAFGNTRERLERALEADIDGIEADIWYRAGELYVRHEPRLEPLPLLVDRRMRGHSLPPLSLPLWKGLYVRLDFNRLKLPDILEIVGGRRKLFLDLKGSYSGRTNDAFARKLVEVIRASRAEEWTAVCGQHWPVLDAVEEQAGNLEVWHSVQRLFQWEKFMRMVRENAHLPRVCIEHRFLNEERARYLEEQGISVFCWTVDNWDEAVRLARAGVYGIISNDLEVLSGLHEWSAAAG